MYAQARGLMPPNVILRELVDNEIVESALKCLKKALPLTFLVVDLLFLLARVVRGDLEQALYVPEEGLRGRDGARVRGAAGLADRHRRRGDLRVVQGLGALRAWRRQRQVLRNVRHVCNKGTTRYFCAYFVFSIHGEYIDCSEDKCWLTKRW